MIENFNAKYLHTAFILTIIVSSSNTQLANNTNSTQSARIIGGSPTTINRLKYLVHLRLDGKFTCGGSLITTQYVVTAAHCVKGVKHQSLTVVGGATYLSDKGVRRAVSKVYVPKAYRMDTMHMDVAVLKLSSAMTGTNIATINLCNSSWQVGDTVQVSGWGITSENGKNPSEQVRSVNVTLVAKNSCVQKYRKVSRLTQTMFCASVPGKKDSCEGDSGGPVVFKGQLCGIVSWGVGCGRAQYPGVYTNIKIVEPFIKAAMKLNG